MAESQKKKAAESTLAEAAKGFDRDQLGAKTRVHALAKMLGGTSKELVGALKDLGWNKVAQSTLSQEEATALLDHLAGEAQKAPAKGTKKRAEKAPKAEKKPRKKDEAAEEKEKKPRRSRKRAKPEEDKAESKDAAQADEQARPEPAPEPERAEEESVERIRHRVEKNVANEIHQIEEKVDKDLSEQVAQAEAAQEEPSPAPEEQDEPAAKPRRRARKTGSGKAARAAKEPAESEESPETAETSEERGRVGNQAEAPEQDAPRERAEEEGEKGRGRRRHRRAVRRTASEPTQDEPTQDKDAEPRERAEQPREDEETPEAKKPRRRGRRGTRRGRGAETDAAEQTAEPAPEAKDRPQGTDPEEPEQPDAEPKEEIQEPVALKGSTRLEAQRRRRSERSDEARRKRHVISQAEFLARRESVERTMVVRERDRHDHHGVVTQVGVLEDDLLVEHFVTSDQQTSMIGNIYLGRVQNVLPSMEAAFIDIGKGRNGVLYAGEVDWKAAGLGGRSRKIEQALRAGDQVLVQVTKDPVGHKGARLTTQVSLAGRFLVYVPGGRSAGISRKLPGPERKRLKEILKEVVPNQGGAIIRTAAEGVPEEAIAADVRRLHGLWQDIQERAEQEKASRGATPVTLYEEPDMLVKVVRDLFNEDFGALVVEGRRAWNTVHAYVQSVAPDLEDRLTYYDREEHGGTDVFEAYRVEEQLQKALARMVWLPSGGSLVMDRTEAMTVIDVNTGRFTGSGGNLEETVTRNNLEAAEEIVRQLRLRDVGGMIVIDFIDMVLPENRDLVLRRLKEALGRDRTRHQVSEVTSLGLVQLTRKRLGTGLVETFSTECPTCEGRGLLLHDDPVEHGAGEKAEKYAEADRKRKGKKQDKPAKEPRRSIEELASAVVPAETTVTSETTEEEPVSEVEKIAAAAVETADELDPHEPNGAHYEQAVAEFEASPRRKRRTRGNSRSDRRPRPEDFAPEAQAPAKEPGTEEPAGGGRSEASERSDVIRRRHRRRAVRRAAGRRTAESGSRRQAAQPRRGAAPTESTGREEAASSSSAPRRRGRRRVTRRRG